MQRKQETTGQLNKQNKEKACKMIKINANITIIIININVR